MTYEYPAEVMQAHAEENRKIYKRIEAVREFCEEAIAYDARPDGALTNRAWCAQSVLNILDGNIDGQL